jgi:hypothetical protein
MPAPAQASSKMGISSQNRAKNIVVMQDNFPNLTRTVPARGKLKYCLKFSYKYANVLLIILMFFGMPHSITSIPLIGRMGFSINSLTLINDKWRDNQILGLQVKGLFYLSTGGLLFLSAIALSRVKLIVEIVFFINSPIGGTFQDLDPLAKLMCYGMVSVGLPNDIDQSLLLRLA